MGPNTLKAVTHGMEPDSGPNESYIIGFVAIQLSYSALCVFHDNLCHLRGHRLGHQSQQSPRTVC